MAVIIFKPITRCNSNCIYCDVIHPDNAGTMTLDLLNLFFQRVNEYLEKYPIEKIKLTWHGGEVCLLGIKFFKKVIEYQDTYCALTKKRIRHQVQSNATMINQDFIDIFKSLGIDKIGTSYEPIQNIRGIGKERDSYTYNKKFLNGISLLNKNNISWGIIYVVHKRSLGKPEDIFYTLSNLNIGNQPMLNKIYIYDDDKNNLRITCREYADFLGKLLPVYLNHPVRFPVLIPISNIIEKIKNPKVSLHCEYSGSCGNKWMYVGPNGNTSQCGRSGDYNTFNYGNIKDKTLEQVLQDPQRESIHTRQLFLKENFCKDCRFWGLCHGGCPNDALLSFGTLLRPASYCEWIKIFITEYVEPMTGLRANLPPQ